MLFSVRVAGESMWPSLCPGKRYLASALIRPRVGSIIVFHHPRMQTEIFVKRVEEIQARGYRVSGLVPWSISSRAIGTVPKHAVIGTLLLPCRYG